VLPSLEKVTGKTRPTFIYRENNFVNKVDPVKLLEGNANSHLFNKAVFSGRDVAEQLKKNNKKLNDFTVVYAKEAGVLTEKEQMAL